MSSSANLIAVYRRAFSRALGEGRISAFKGLTASDTDFQTKRALGGLAPGERFIDPVTGNVYRVGRARAAVGEAGLLLKTYVGAAGRIGTGTANSTKAVFETADNLVAHDLVNGYFTLTGGTGAPETRLIIDNDDTAANSLVTVSEADRSYPGTTAITSPDAFTTLPDNTTTYSIFCPWEVLPTTAVTSRVVGVSLGAVSDGDWFIYLEKGYGYVKAAGDTDAITADGPIVPSATAGVGKGPTGAGITATEARVCAAYALEASTAAARLVFCQVTGINNLL
jgi:hypothetical protein